MANNLVISGFTLFGLEISFYGILMAVGFILAFFICRKLLKTKGYNPEIVLDLLLIIFPMSIIGARLYYVIFSGRAWTFVEILSVWDGGLAIYGGIIGGFLGVLIYSLIKKINLLDLLDAIAVGLILAQGIGRIGCYTAGCCYGVEVTESLQFFPFAVLIDGTWHYATFFYEAFWNILGFIILWFVYNKYKQRALTTGGYLAYYGFGRFFIEAVRGDSLYIGTLKVSQVLSLILFVVGVSLIVYSFLRKRQIINEQKSKT